MILLAREGIPDCLQGYGRSATECGYWTPDESSSQIILFASKPIIY